MVAEAGAETRSECFTIVNPSAAAGATASRECRRRSLPTACEWDVLHCQAVRVNPVVPGPLAVSMPASSPDGFRSWFAPVASLSDAEWKATAERLMPVRLAPGETFLAEGETRRQVGFVREGALRYSVLRDGDEHVTAFDFEGDVAGDLDGFFDGAPAIQTITAVEATTLDVLTHDAFEALVRDIPSLASVRGVVSGNLFDGARARAAELQQFTPEERYRRLLARSPRVVQRVPLYHVASYLGVTPEALSRIRRRVATG